MKTKEEIVRDNNVLAYCIEADMSFINIDHLYNAMEEYASQFASQNPEIVIAFANYFHKEKELMRRTGQMSNGSIMNPQELYQKFFSDLCSSSQETTKDIKLGEVFNVDGKKYAIQKPKTSSEETDPHGTITYYLTEI